MQLFKSLSRCEISVSKAAVEMSSLRSYLNLDQQMSPLVQYKQRLPKLRCRIMRVSPHLSEE